MLKLLLIYPFETSDVLSKVLQGLFTYSPGLTFLCALLLSVFS